MKDALALRAEKLSEPAHLPWISCPDTVPGFQRAKAKVYNLVHKKPHQCPQKWSPPCLIYLDSSDLNRAATKQM
jgi:hypothetical protein